MSNKSYAGDYLHSDRAELIGDAVKAAIRNAIKHNDVVGSIVGYYDGSLTILSVSEYLLHNLGYTHEEFMRFKCSAPELRILLTAPASDKYTDSARDKC